MGAEAEPSAAVSGPQTSGCVLAAQQHSALLGQPQVPFLVTTCIATPSKDHTGPSLQHPFFAHINPHSLFLPLSSTNTQLEIPYLPAMGCPGNPQLPR